jgi:hypothetical protein
MTFSEEGTFSVSVDTGVLSAWRERESLLLFTLLQYAGEEPFTLHNGSSRAAPLVPHVGVLGTRQHPNFTLVRVPLRVRKFYDSFTFVICDCYFANRLCRGDHVLMIRTTTNEKFR